MTKEDPRLKRVFPKPSVVAYRRGKNLRDLLVRAKINTVGTVLTAEVVVNFENFFEVILVAN